MTVSAWTRLRPKPPERVLSRNSRGASGASPPSWKRRMSSRRDSMSMLPSMRQIGQPLCSVAQSSMMSSIVVNWLNSRTLWPRANSASSSRSSTIIFPLVVTSSSPRTCSRVRGSLGQWNRNGCWQTLRSCMMTFLRFLLFTSLTAPP